MKNLVLICILTAATVSCSSQSRTISLFNGEDLSGWHVDVPAMDEDPDVENPFIVRDGMLVTLASPMGHLITDEEYQDYRVEAEYRFAGEPGNTGLLVHASTPRVIRNMLPQSIEVQTMHQQAGDFWLWEEDLTVDDMENRREEGGRHVARLTSGAENPVGEWNTLIVETLDDSINVWVNDVLVNYGYDITTNKGQIGVQAEGAEVEFRKIELTPITELN